MALTPGELGCIQLVPAPGVWAGLVVRTSAHGTMLALATWAGLGGKEHGEGWGWGCIFILSGR